MVNKPMWKEGIFMMPQHLQLMDEYHEQLLDNRLQAMFPNSWGISELEVDADELARGVFRLGSTTAVLPDGVLVQIGRNQELKGLLAMTAGGLTGGGQSLDVYLSVPGAEVGGASPEGEKTGTRFIHKPVPIPDAFETGPETEVECLQPNVQLLMGSDNRQNFVTIKIAELILNESGRLAVNENYIPPSLRVNVSPLLMRSLGRLVSSLGAKQKDLVSKYGHRQAAMIEFGAADIATFLYLHTVNSWLPIFMHYAASGDLHPEQLFLSLASFAGQLASFEATSDPLELPRFNYLNISESLLPLFDLIFNLLGTVVSSRYKTIPLDQTQPGLFVGRVEDPSLLRNMVLYLIAGGDVPEETLRDDLLRYVKVGSIDQIAQIVRSALPGVGVRVDHTPPNAIPVRAHMVYIKLEKEGRYWDSVLQSNTIAIYQPVKPERVKLELVAVEG